MARNKAKKAKKEIKRKMTMFGMLGDECNMCQKPFDKKSKEHATTWNVVVREKEEVVRIYCPDCWGSAMKIIEEVQNDFGIQDETRSDSADTSQPQ